MTNTGGGPKTQAGKDVARWNATRHGIRSPAPVVPGLEKAEDWEAHRDGVLENLSPEGHLELVLAERVALLSWRLHRVTRYETESIALSQEKMEEDLMEKSQILGPSISEAMYPKTCAWTTKTPRRPSASLRGCPRLQVRSASLPKRQDSSSL